MNRWWIGKIGIQDDHVHLLIQLQADDSVAETVRVLKGGTSKVIRKEFPELEEFLWGDSLWADGYFAESIGRVDEESIKKYINEQRK
jgi:putative transposase